MDFARKDLKYRDIKEILPWDLSEGSPPQVEEAEYYLRMKDTIVKDPERERKMDNYCAGNTRRNETFQIRRYSAL